MTQVEMFAYSSKLDADFAKFHAENPDVYKKLVSMTQEARIAGKRKVGMKMLFEVIRWEHLVHTRSDDFALNNNYTSRYVRLLAEDHPELADMFDQRRMRS